MRKTHYYEWLHDLTLAVGRQVVPLWLVRLDEATDDEDRDKANNRSTAYNSGNGRVTHSQRTHSGTESRKTDYESEDLASFDFGLRSTQGCELNFLLVFCI